MKYFYFLIIVLSMQSACAAWARQQTFEQVKAERKAFRKSSYVIEQPKEYFHRELDGEKSYDPKPRIVMVDEKAGKYEFRWIGYDGKEKIVAYQRHDAIDAIVAATVEKKDEGKLLYKYNLKILPTSPTYFRGFVVQTFAEDAKPIRINDSRFYVGYKTNSIPIFKDGVWWSYAFVGEDKERIQGGGEIEFQLPSSGLPGIVGCKAVGGELGIKDVGEDMPTELDDAIPFVQDYATGYTIGPIESLSGLSKSDRAKYILDNLPKFIEAGWMSDGTAKNYEAILKRDDLAGAFEKAKKDLENEFITSEVFHIIEGLQEYTQTAH